MNWQLLRVAAALAVVIGWGDTSLAQNVKLPIPGEPVNPQSREECEAMSREWSDISKAITEQHGECLRGQACKNSAGNDTAGQCSCGACLRLHLLMNRYSSGDLAQIRRQRMDQCNRKVAAYEESRRQQRLAEQEEQRARQQAANQAALQYADAQRQYADMQRRQREQANAVTAQQLENQRRKLERLQQQQQQSQQAAASLSAMLSGGSAGARSSLTSSMQPLPERPQSVIGTTLDSASQVVNLASQAKEDIGATMAALTLAMSSDRQSRADASASLSEYAASKATDAAVSAVTSAVVAFMPRRNDYNDPGFSAFFEAAQSNTTGRAPSSPTVSFIQRVSGGVLESMLQQTLGDMAQLERDINSFSAGSPSYYTSGSRPMSIGGSGSSSVTSSRSNSSDSAANGSPSGSQDLNSEEVEALRQGLRYAMAETRVSIPSLIRFVGTDNSVEGLSASSCRDRVRGLVVDGQQICTDGRALKCRAGKLQPAGSC